MNTHARTHRPTKPQTRQRVNGLCLSTHSGSGIVRPSPHSPLVSLHGHATRHPFPAGYEELALKGFRQVLADPQRAPCHIWMEVFPQMLQGAGSDPERMLLWLNNLGYHVSRDGTHVIEPSMYKRLIQQYSGSLVDLNLFRK